MTSTGLKRLNALAVDLNGRHVGTLHRLGGETHAFAFEQDYLADPDRPTLSLSYKSRTGGLVTTVRPVRRRLPPFFSNLLPEGHLRTYLADQAGVHPDREFFLIAALGADLAGAVTVRPLDAHAAELAFDDEPLRPERGRRGPLRFSLAGVQLKFSAVMERSGGLTIPARGVGGSWIVKLPSMRFAAVAENEFAMLELARAIGIDVPRTALVPVADIDGLPADAATVSGNALTIERFDRGPNGERIHMEDFAQVFGLFPEGKYKSVSYANIARVLWSETGETGALEFVRRLVFSILTGNADMHLKNWSILYPDGRSPILSPAYDLLSTIPYIPGDRLALTLGGSRDLEAVHPDQVRRFVETAGLPTTPVVRTVLDTVDATVTAWRTLPAKDLLPNSIRDIIGAQIDTGAAATLSNFSVTNRT